MNDDNDKITIRCQDWDDGTFNLCPHLALKGVRTADYEIELYEYAEELTVECFECRCNFVIRILVN